MSAGTGTSGCIWREALVEKGERPGNFPIDDQAHTMLLGFEAESQNRFEGIFDGISILIVSKLLILNIYWLLR
jgi:hypothetical protein